MSLVQDAGRAQVAARFGGLLLAGLLLAGCFGSAGGDAPQQGPAARLVQVRLANCRDWRRAGVRERATTVAAVKQFAGGPSGSPGGHGATLPDDKAYELFDSYCRYRFARGFKLYKLYVRAADFAKR